MEKNSSATDDTEMPPIPTFSFEIRGREEVNDSSPGKQDSSSDEPVKDTQQSCVKTESSDKPDIVKPKKQTAKKAAAIANAQGKSPPVIFSTDVRRSIQTDLAIISYSKGQTIKHILNEALTLWLASPELTVPQIQKKLKLMEFPEHDPVDSFSNRISFDLKRQLAKLKFEREGIHHPVRTIAAFTEQAFINWIPLQEEFSVGERNQRLAQLAA